MIGIERGDIVEFEWYTGERMIGKVIRKALFYYEVYVEEKKMTYLVVSEQIKRVCKNESSYP